MSLCNHYHSHSVMTEIWFDKSNVPDNHFYLGENIFVVIKKHSFEIKVFICKYFMTQNEEWYFEKDCIYFPSTLWYKFVNVMDVDNSFSIPEYLIVNKRKGKYFIQRLFVKPNNFQRFIGGQCCLNKRQWDALKKLHFDILDSIVVKSFGDLFTDFMMEYSDTLGRDSTEELCRLLLTELNLNMIGDRVQIWERDFFPAAFGIDVGKLARTFWNTYGTCTSTIGRVKEIFHRVYDMYLTFDK